MCLNIGQNWESSFVQALINSRIIILLISLKVVWTFRTLAICLIFLQALQGIKDNAPTKQDNVLVEYPLLYLRLALTMMTTSIYECALLQNKLKGTPVIPLCVAEATITPEEDPVFTTFSFRNVDPSSFPDTPHARGRDVQNIVDSMRYFTFERGI